MSKKIKRFFLIILLFAFLPGVAQTVLLQVDRSIDSLPSERGPNLKKFTHFFLTAGLVAGSDSRGARIKYGASLELGSGVRWKYKIGNVYSLGYELQLNYLEFKMDQGPGKIVPDSNRNDVERMDFYSIQAGLYNRFNVDPERGNYLGYYLDLGIRGEWDFGIRHIIKNELPDGSYATSSIAALPYVNRFNGRVFGRIGLNRILVYVSYRFSDLFKSKYEYPELPRLTTGIELSIFRQ